MSGQCQRCGDDSFDLRTLYHRCFYDMSELNLPFTYDEDGFYKLTVCKDCRGDWMHSIQTWFNHLPARESSGSGIFIRKNGASVEVTEDQYKITRLESEVARLREALEYYARESNWTDGDVPTHVYALDDKGHAARAALQAEEIK